MFRLLFYSDTAEYGGHEAMTLEAVKYFAENKNIAVEFAFSEQNGRMWRKLREIQKYSSNLQLHPLKVQSRKLQAVRTLLCPWQVSRVKSLMKGIGPDLVVISQGRIESCTLGLLAAKRAGFRAISYIPMAHDILISGKPVAIKFREAVNRYFYRLPDKLITISESAKRMLLAQGARSRVVVVPNGVEPKIVQEGDRKSFRESHGLQPDDYVVAVIGRIEFWQKRQDFVVEGLAARPNALPGCKFLFIGGGADEAELRTMISSSGLENRVRVLPWNECQREIYAGIDMLLIPSRFEGVPLVMLEAMSCGLPVVASRVDGMAEFLPAEWLFPMGDAEAMITAISRVKESAASQLTENNKDRVLKEFTIKQFCVNFSDAVLAEI